MDKLDQRAKRLITADWASALVELGIWKPMWCARILGPLVHGVTLDRDGSGQSYYPTSFIGHLSDWGQLGVPLPIVFQGLASKNPNIRERIPVRYHEERWRTAATRMRTQTAIPFEQNPSVDELLRILDSVPHPNEYDTSAARGAILLCVSCSRLVEAQHRLARLEEFVESWPRHLIPPDWSLPLAEAIANPEAHRAAEKVAFATMKLAKLPYRPVSGCTDDPRG